MAFFVLVGFIWLIILQVTVSRLQEQIDDLKASSTTKPKETITPRPNATPVATPSAEKPVPANVHFEMHEEKETPQPQVAQPAKVYAAKPKEPAKPPPVIRIIRFLGINLLNKVSLWSIAIVSISNRLPPFLFTNCSSAAAMAWSPKFP